MTIRVLDPRDEGSDAIDELVEVLLLVTLWIALAIGQKFVVETEFPT